MPPKQKNDSVTDLQKKIAEKQQQDAQDCFKEVLEVLAKHNMDLVALPKLYVDQTNTVRATAEFHVVPKQDVARSGN